MLAALQHLTAKRISTEVARFTLDFGSADDPIDAILQLVWDIHSAPIFVPIVELWVAGTDAECLGAAPPVLPDNLRVRWIGHVPYERMPEIYAEAGILAFPTLADEWGLVVNEAMAAGEITVRQLVEH